MRLLANRPSMYPILVALLLREAVCVLCVLLLVPWFGPWLLALAGYTHLYYFLHCSEQFIRLYMFILNAVVARKTKVVLYIVYCSSIPFAVCECIARTLEKIHTS